MPRRKNYKKFNRRKLLELMKELGLNETMLVMEVYKQTGFIINISSVSMLLTGNRTSAPRNLCAIFSLFFKVPIEEFYLEDEKPGEK